MKAISVIITLVTFMTTPIAVKGNLRGHRELGQVYTFSMFPQEVKDMIMPDTSKISFDGVFGSIGLTLDPETLLEHSEAFQANFKNDQEFDD